MGMEQLKLHELERIVQWSREGGNLAKSREAEKLVSLRSAKIAGWKPRSPEAAHCPDCGSNSGSVELEQEERRKRLKCTKCACRGPWIRIRRPQ